jgi:hypothetical protein
MVIGLFLAANMVACGSTRQQTLASPLPTLTPTPTPETEPTTHALPATTNNSFEAFFWPLALLAILGIVAWWSTRGATSQRTTKPLQVVQQSSVRPVMPLTIRVNGKKRTMPEIYEHNWRIVLARFWAVWAYYGFCGRDKFKKLTGINVKRAWPLYMQRLQALGLIRVRHRVKAEVLVSGKVVYAIIRRRPLLPLPRSNAPLFEETWWLPLEEIYKNVPPIGFYDGGLPFNDIDGLN